MISGVLFDSVQSGTGSLFVISLLFGVSVVGHVANIHDRGRKRYLDAKE